ncbi:NADP-dependent oxidoreductase [Pediococcus acidilactici]|uniref:NADP-dependent oxidoreductase n=1 Tax=Pediococcus acidilactici TaxID=1254 RepID=UPI00137C06F4|nr:NADP-dependent oxidoreductase [Pediococcus acidilactici]QHS03715.1 NADP-dependent oxidoreductase [Pediococcus acidilactici]
MKEVNESIPTPKANEVIVEVAAIGLADPDIVMRKNGPFPTMPVEMRPTLPHMIGNDYSGVITAVGEKVSKFKIGDHVVGLTLNGTYAEYLSINEDEAIATVPASLDLVPLGGLLLAAMTAWSATVTNGKIEAGQKVLIHGGAGGVGSMAIQIAKAAGAYVITTAKKKHQVYLKGLGIDQIIDYQTEDFTKIVDNLDLVVNLTGVNTMNASYQVVKPGGRLISANGVPDQRKATKYGIEVACAMGDTSSKALSGILKRYQDGKLNVNVAKTYQFELDSVKQAHLDFEKGII